MLSQISPLTGRAEFVECDSRRSNNRMQSACIEPYEIVSNAFNCLDTIDVTEGETVQFNTSIVFVSGGDCGCKEGVTLQRFYREGNSSPLTFCIDNCPSGPGQSFVDPIVNVTMNDAGMYVLQVEVSLPRTSGRECFLKFYNLTVNPGESKQDYFFLNIGWC